MAGGVAVLVLLALLGTMLLLLHRSGRLRYAAPPEGGLPKAGGAVPGVHLRPPASRRWRRRDEAEPAASAGLPLGFRNPLFDVMVFKQQVR